MRQADTCATGTTLVVRVVRIVFGIVGKDQDADIGDGHEDVVILAVRRDGMAELNG